MRTFTDLAACVTGVMILGTLTGTGPRFAYGQPPTRVVVVNPASSPALVRDVDTPAREPFQRRLTFTINPAGRRIRNG